MKEKIVVLGAGGMAGTSLMPLLKEGYDVEGYRRGQADITNGKEILELVQKARPKWVVNLAAQTNVDGCETDAEAAFRVNRDGARNIAEAVKSIPGAKMVHISTDFVFDGTKKEPYQETDSVNPQSVYGKSKAEGEQAVWEVLPQRSLIVRTSWVFGPGGKNFVDTMLSLAEKAKVLKVVDDQTGRPTYTRDLSEAVKNLMAVNALGYVHFANEGACTWNVFARGIFEAAGIQGIDVQKVTSKEFVRPAKRPAYSVLSTERYEKLTGRPVRHWREALKDYLAEREGAPWPSSS